MRDINLRVAAVSEAFEDVVSTVESALLKFEFRHRFALIRMLDALQTDQGSVLRGVCVGGRLC